MLITEHDKPSAIDTAALTFTVTIEHDEMPAFDRMKRKLDLECNEDVVGYFFQHILEDTENKQFQAVEFAVDAGLSLERAMLFANYMIERDWDVLSNQPYMLTWVERFKHHTEWERSDSKGQAILRRLAPDKY